MTDDPVELAWLAGLFELSGSVSVFRRGEAEYPMVRIGGDQALINRIARLTDTPPPDSKSDRLRWTQTGVPAVEFLRAIAPYLHGPRRDKADAILQRGT